MAMEKQYMAAFERDEEIHGFTSLYPSSDYLFLEFDFMFGGVFYFK